MRRLVKGEHTTRRESLSFASGNISLKEGGNQSVGRLLFQYYENQKWKNALVELNEHCIVVYKILRAKHLLI